MDTSAIKDISIKSLDRRRFDALAGYIRQPRIVLLTQELEWFATDDERLLGIVSIDRIDHDFSWVILGRDEKLRYRAIDVQVSCATTDTARVELHKKLGELWKEPDASFHQGDTSGAPTDFFEPIAAADRQHPFFRKLLQDELYSPARDIISAMMRFHEDADGNFVEQFQSVPFDARLWELYLFATFNELGYARELDVAVPDFLLSGLQGRFGVEATTVNPPQAGEAPQPRTEADFLAYLENYVPIKLARALRRKLQRRNPYWKMPQMKGVPFVLAIQDFHGPGVMRMIPHAATEYVFGVRHRVVDGERHIERISEHRFGDVVERSGFFSLSGAENVSAVIVNAQGTITKFNRIGYIAGFGNRRVRMVRTGVRRGELDDDGPAPKRFIQNVHDAAYHETWIEGMIVLHNPRALVPLDPMLLEGAAHEFLEENGSIMSILPQFHPHFSQTAITMASE